MGDWNPGLRTLGEEALRKLAAMLDNPRCGWRQLAAALTERPQFRYSEKQLMGCSLQVLSSTGSPSRSLLAMLADHACSLGFLLHCFAKIERHSAVQYLSVTGGYRLLSLLLQPGLPCVLHLLGDNMSS